VTAKSVEDLLVKLVVKQDNFSTVMNEAGRALGSLYFALWARGELEDYRWMCDV
jgi:hypothetical protein